MYSYGKLIKRALETPVASYTTFTTNTTHMTILTFPGVTAYHVVGDSSVELAHGDLALIAPESPTAGNEEKAPVLMLTVGSAAFQLYNNTVFGTVAEDERVYVFKPELGEGVSGYVKLVLPEGVQEPNTEFSALQERFEKLLINRGLLTEGDNMPAKDSVSIPAVKATHVLGETTVQLAHGKLSLSTVAPRPSDGPQPILILTVDEAVFPLHKTTLFGTVAGNERVYLFQPEIQDANVPAGSFIKITLPDNAGGLSESAQEQFEQLLIDHGLLKTGVLAVGDEISRSMNEDAHAAARTVKETTADFLNENPPTDSPLKYSETTHSITSAASSATSTLYDTAASISSTVSSAASSASAFLSNRATGGPPSEETRENAATMGGVYNSIGSGVNVLKEAVTQSVGDVVEHQLGRETRTVGGNVAESIGNGTGALGQVAEVGTGAVLVSGGVKGAVGLAPEEGQGVPSAHDEEEMAAFTISERGDEESSEWKEVPV
ncbi:hypothetical protein BDW22DRAFT_1351848 [Trametopsis cervina]|nr:hypothetical protein BDW22DRAFT_1351848 [Trametopsis cervina]